ncbi:MAG TPA: hypothetical protein VK084_06165 [Chitinophagaceae bacterium]|nr:hypothetical protein [Chitinophagaceae bacterium]
MNQEILNQQERVNSDVSLDGFIVKETLATHLIPNKRSNRSFCSAQLRKIQNKKRGASIRLYSRYF